jgi:hypothetical protein
VVALGGATCSKWRKSQQHLGGRRFHSNEEVEMAVGEWLQMQEPDFRRDGILNSCQDGTNALMCSGIMLKNNFTSVE